MKRMLIAATRGTGRFCLSVCALTARTVLVLGVLAAITVGAVLAPIYMPVPPAYAQWSSGVLRAVSGLTGSEEVLRSTDGALWAFGQLLECEDEAAQVCRIRDGADEYERVTTTGSDVRLGVAGADGDFLADVTFEDMGTTNGICTIRDGSTTVHIVPANFTEGNVFPVNKTATAANGWAINCAQAGAIAVARGIFDTP